MATMTEKVYRTTDMEHIGVKTFNSQGRVAVSGPSVGIAMYPDDSADAGQLLMYAGAAKELAKKTGRDNLQYYTPEITQQAETRRSLEADLHKAVQKNELRLHFQPLLELRHRNNMFGMTDAAQSVVVPPSQIDRKSVV